MAIAGFFALHSPRNRKRLQALLGGMTQITSLVPVDVSKLAGTIEMPGAHLTGFLKKISDLPEVDNLELVYVNYEDDLDESGFMQAPPEARKHD